MPVTTDAILIKPLFEDGPDTPGFYAIVAGERTVQDRVLSFPIGDSELRMSLVSATRFSKFQSELLLRSASPGRYDF
jgi:hypothetical protein